MNMQDITRIAQSCFEECPTIILGSGASIPHGLPDMNALSAHLHDSLELEETEENDSWQTVRAALAKGDHLETALEGKELSPSLLQKIINLTWQCVNEKDMSLLEAAASNGNDFALGRLLSAMFKSTQSEIHVITTNYDRVVEYACNSVGLLYQTGFTPGYIQKWESADRVKFMHGSKSSRVVKIWKVHGSLDWFRTGDGRMVGLPVFDLPSKGYRPLIVTPGLNKYEKTHEDPFRTTISGADAALGDATAFLCVGFGFRDRHIHPKIIERCREENLPTVVLAKTLTDEARDFLRDNAGINYMGIEQYANGSKIFTSSCPDGIEVAHANLWSLAEFNNLVQ